MKKISIEIKWAFIFIISSLLWMVLERLAGLHDKRIHLHQYLTMLFMVPAIAIYVFALLDKKRNYYKGVITYRQGFVSGLIISIIVTIFAPLTQWATSEIITPNYFSNAIAYSVKTGYFKSLAEAEAFFNLKNYMLQSVVGAILMGIATAAVLAFFVRTKSAKVNDALT